MGRRRAGIAVVAAGLIGVGAGCGDDAPAGRKPTMLPGARTAAEDATSRGVNRAPEIEEIGIRPARPSPGRVVEARARAHDPDGDLARISFRWRTRDGRMLGEGDRLDTTGLEAGDRLELVAVATDGRAESESVVHGFQLAGPSVAIALVAIGNGEGAHPGSVLEAVVETTDESVWSDTEVEWLANGEVVGDDDELDTSALAPGDVIELRASLATDGGRSPSVKSRPVVLRRGGAPEIVSDPVAGMQDGLFEYRMRARSPVSGAELEYRLLKAPDGMQIDPERGVVTWRPGSEQRGRFEVEVGVVDQWGSGSAQSFAIQIDAPEGQAPASPR